VPNATSGDVDPTLTAFGGGNGFNCIRKDLLQGLGEQDSVARDLDRSLLAKSTSIGRPGIWRATVAAFSISELRSQVSK